MKSTSIVYTNILLLLFISLRAVYLPVFVVQIKNAVCFLRVIGSLYGREARVGYGGRRQTGVHVSIVGRFYFFIRGFDLFPPAVPFISFCILESSVYLQFHPAKNAVPYNPRY